MATTSLWHIKGRLKDLINYVENPEKTASKTPELQDLYNVFSYVQRPEATQEGEYVTAINCLKETALRQMILTKKRYGKTDGYIAWHGYQSFKPEEVTPQLAHEIGVKLAKEMWGDHPPRQGAYPLPFLLQLRFFSGRRQVQLFQGRAKANDGNLRPAVPGIWLVRH